MADAERWAAGMPVPAYAIDDETAIKVVDGAVEVVSEGHWKLFTPPSALPNGSAGGRWRVWLTWRGTGEVITVRLRTAYEAGPTWAGECYLIPPALPCQTPTSSRAGSNPRSRALRDRSSRPGWAARGPAG